MYIPCSWNARAGTAILAFIALMLLAACGIGGPGAPKVSAQQAADIVMGGLQNLDYAEAYDALSSDAAGREFGSPEQLQTWIEENQFRPRLWTWGDPVHKTSGENSYVELQGTVTYADGSTGTVVTEMEALGMQDNPWRFRTFELRR